MKNNGIIPAKTSCHTIEDHWKKERIIKIQNDVSCLNYITHYVNIYIMIVIPDFQSKYYPLRHFI